MFVPGVLPGDWHLVVRADIYNQTKEGLGEADNQTAFGPVLLSLRQLLTDGTPIFGALTHANHANYFQVSVAEGENLGILLKTIATSGVTELYVGLDAIPTRLRYDFKVTKDEGSLAKRDPIVAVAAPQSGGTYYILVYGDQLESPTEYELTAKTGPIIITSISPERHGNAAPATVTLTGAGFDETTTVEFVSDATVRLPDEILFLSPETLRLHLPLTDWPAGLYTVRVVKGPAINELPNAFEVVQGGIAHLETRLIVPSAVGIIIPIRQTVWIEYRNDGALPMPAPLLVLRGDSGARITADPALAIPRGGFGAIPGVSDTVQVLGFASSATPWILQPGESGRIPVYYLGLSVPGLYPRVTFTLEAITANDIREIDWLNQAPLIGGTGISITRWFELQKQLVSQAGRSWGEHVAELNRVVRMLSLIENAPHDHKNAWAYIRAATIPEWLTLLLKDVPAKHRKLHVPGPPSPNCPENYERLYTEYFIARLQAGYRLSRPTSQSARFRMLYGRALPRTVFSSPRTFLISREKRHGFFHS